MITAEAEISIKRAIVKRNKRKRAVLSSSSEEGLIPDTSYI